MAKAPVCYPEIEPSMVQVSNLMLAAGPTHEWYKQRFAAYPRERRALIPWLY